ncbi:MAG: hypothetical protein R6V53_02610, partial [Candidatus Woesearchaeota archaeon]
LTREEAEYQVNNNSAFECVEDASMWEVVTYNDEIKYPWTINTNGRIYIVCLGGFYYLCQKIKN